MLYEYLAFVCDAVLKALRHSLYAYTARGNDNYFFVPATVENSNLAFYC